MNTLTRNQPVAGDATRESRFALRVAACLTEQSEQVTPDVSERLRIGREQALERARQARRLQSAESRSGLTAVGLAILGGGWWARLGLVLPLVALVVGLALIQHLQDEEQVNAAADIDAALLADDVPPRAYGDPGFVEFLKSPRN